jgi:hypothetical protein
MPELEKVDETLGVVRVERRMVTRSRLRGTPPMSGPEHGWPPRPAGVAALTSLPLNEAPAPLTPERRARLVGTATVDPKVREALGDRFEPVSIQEVDPGKDQAPGDPVPRTRLFFFNHALGATVDVLMAGETVERSVVRRGFQPPETRAEIERAIELARSDPRLGDKVASQFGEAILAQPHPDTDPLANHRVLYVAFYHEEGKAPTHAARVDLTAMQVLSVRHFESA